MVHIKKKIMLLHNCRILESPLDIKNEKIMERQDLYRTRGNSSCKTTKSHMQPIPVRKSKNAKVFFVSYIRFFNPL